MKIIYLVVVSFILICLFGFFSYMSKFSSGTLGSVGETYLNCSAIDVGQRIDVLLEINPFKIQAKDTATVNSWQKQGYDFLTFRCININKRLYMITIANENPTESVISIRAYYNRNKKKWIVAKEFTSEINFRAEKAMESLSNEMTTCQ